MIEIVKTIIEIIFILMVAHMSFRLKKLENYSTRHDQEIWKLEGNLRQQKSERIKYPCAITRIQRELKQIQDYIWINFGAVFP